MANVERAATDLDAAPVPGTGPDDPPLGYGRYYYDHDCGEPYRRTDQWLGFFGQIAERIVSELAPATVLDAGCAMGFLVEKLRELGVDAEGVDVSSYAIESAHESINKHVSQRSLTDALPGRYDLITCFEVVEHMSAPDSERAIANLCAHTDRVLFSSTPLDYAEPTHVNVHPPEDWSVMFARHGFIRDVDFDLTTLVPWAVLYRRAELPQAALIRTYERTWWRLKHENRELRQTVLDLQSRLEAIDWEDRQLEPTQAALAERDRQLGEALTRINDLQEELRILDSRTGRLLRAYHQARATFRK